MLEIEIYAKLYRNNVVVMMMMMGTQDLKL